MTNDELAQKFRSNAEGVIPSARIDAILDALQNLAKVRDSRSFMRLLGPSG